MARKADSKSVVLRHRPGAVEVLQEHSLGDRDLVPVESDLEGGSDGWVARRRGSGRWCPRPRSRCDRLGAALVSEPYGAGSSANRWARIASRSARVSAGRNRGIVRRCLRRTTSSSAAWIVSVVDLVPRARLASPTSSGSRSIVVCFLMDQRYADAASDVNAHSRRGRPPDLHDRRPTGPSGATSIRAGSRSSWSRCTGRGRGATCRGRRSRTSCSPRTAWSCRPRSRR